MNFDWLKNSSKTARVLTLSTAGVVAGLVAYNALTSPNYENGTAFYDSGRQNVAYTSGSDAGYDGKKYFSARDINHMDDETARQEALRAQQGQAPQNVQFVEEGYDGLSGDSMPGAYHVDNRQFGLNTDMNDFDGMMGSLTNNAPGMGGLSDLVNNAMSQANAQIAQGAQGANGAGKDGGQGGQGGTLQRASMAVGGNAPGSKGFGNGMGGNNQGIQNSWDGAGGNKDAAAQAAGALAQANAMMQNMKEGTQLTGKGADLNHKARFANGVMSARDAMLNGRYSPGGTDLERARLIAMQTANKKTKDLASNAGADFWMADEKGDVVVEVGDTETNFEFDPSPTSAPDEGNFQSDINSAAGALDDIQTTIGDRTQDANNLKRRLWTTVAIVMALCFAIPFLKKIPIWGWILALAAFAVGVVAVVALGIDIHVFNKKWDSTGISKTATWIDVALGVSLAASLVATIVKGNWLTSILEKVGLKSAGGAAAAGAGKASVGTILGGIVGVGSAGYQAGTDLKHASDALKGLKEEEKAGGK